MISKGVALITGSAGGIGRAISMRLARDGFDIALNDLPKNRDALHALQKQIVSQGRRAIVVAANVTQEKEVKDMTGETVDALGELNVMIANAGICETAPLIKETAEDWDRQMAINGRAAFLSYKYAAIQMIAQGKGGRIIGAGSVSSIKAEPFLCSYGASKFALRGLTQSAAQELGKYNITVNAYAPGPVDTPMLRGFFEKTEMINSMDQESKSAPMGRIGRPEDIAGLVAYLASEEAGWITGQTISPNGGRLLT